MRDPLVAIFEKMQKDEYLKNHKARATKIINDFHIQMRHENLKVLAEMTQNKIGSALTPRDEKILLQEVIDQIQKEIK